MTHPRRHSFTSVFSNKPLRCAVSQQPTHPSDNRCPKPQSPEAPRNSLSSRKSACLKGEERDPSASLFFFPPKLGCSCLQRHPLPLRSHVCFPLLSLIEAPLCSSQVKRPVLFYFVFFFFFWLGSRCLSVLFSVCSLFRFLCFPHERWTKEEGGFLPGQQRTKHH